jgi:hypothetical protein
MRTAVLCGRARPDGVGAIVYHGMWRGLAVLLDATGGTPPANVPAVSAVPFAAAHDRQLVRLLANMVLAAEAQVHYAY